MSGRTSKHNRLKTLIKILPPLALSTHLAWADNAKPDEKIQLPSLDQVKPLKQQPKLLHDFVLSLKYWSSHSSNKDQTWAGSTDIHSATLGISFNIGQIGFAGASVTRGQQKSETTLAFPSNTYHLHLERPNTAWSIEGGIHPLPFLFIGATVGKGTSNDKYWFASFPTPMHGDSSAWNYGAFASGIVPIGKTVLLEPSILVLHFKHDQNYPPGNSPPTNSYDSTILATNLAASYRITPRLTLEGNVANNNVIEEKVAIGSVGHDANWQTLGIGGAYELTKKLALTGKYIAWTSNARQSYHKLSVGLNYKF